MDLRLGGLRPSMSRPMVRTTEDSLTPSDDLSKGNRIGALAAGAGTSRRLAAAGKKFDTRFIIDCHPPDFGLASHAAWVAINLVNPMR